MRKTAILCFALILAGCASNHISDNEFVYDERDAIPNDIPLPKPGVNQRPVVGVRTILVSVVHWRGEDVLNKPLIEKHTLSTDPDSLQSYILAASHGKLTLTGQVIEHTSGLRPESCIKRPNTPWPPMPLTLAIQEGAKAAQAQGLNPDDFDYLINVIDCGGNASANMPGRHIGVYGQSGGPHVYKHEFGHNLGYSHGSTYVKCPKNGDTVQAPLELASIECAVIGYGDTGDSVSGGTTLYPANNRRFSGWIEDSKTAVIDTTGLYRLGVLGQEGPQLYLINRTPALNQIALEYRQPTPFDNFAPDDNRVTGVWIRYTSMTGAVRNVQLDATPETPTTTEDPTLQPGHMLQDTTARIKVKVCTAEKTGATIAVAVNGQVLPYCTTTVPVPNIEAPAPNAKTGLKPVIAGTSWPGARIVVSNTDSPAQILGETLADAHGKWSIQPSSNLSKQWHTVTAQQFFGPKYSVSTPERSFEVVDIEVSPALIESPAKNVQTVPRPIVTGTGIAGATVILLEHNQPHKTLATTIVDGYGKWSVQIDNPLPARTFRLTGYQAIDGKRSGWIADHPIQVIDTPAPAQILTPEKNTQTGMRPVVTGTGIAGATVILLEHNQPHKTLATTVVDGYGKWSVQIDNPLPARTFRLTGYQAIDGKRSGWIADHPIQVIDTAL